jgi:hypothetical protein
MRYVLVNDRSLRRGFCALCCEPIDDSYLREVGTQLLYCDKVCYQGHCHVSILALEHRSQA